LEKANDVLFKKGSVFGVLQEQEAVPRKLKQIDQSYDNELFEILRRKRKELADDQNIPPYVIFSDKALAQMASDYPRDESSLLNISGIGINKLERYGGMFLSIIKRYCENKNITVSQNNRQFPPEADQPLAEAIGGGRSDVGGRQKSKNNPSQVLKHIVISQSFNNGTSIRTLAEEYGIKTQTIVTHIARYANEGHKVRIEGLMEQLSLPAEQHKKVFEAFREDGVSTMKTIFEKFNKEISYEDLYILKIIYMDNIQG
jgi:ATP-dependent DNA helicase RecQ